MRQIPLTKGKVTLVDDQDYDWLMQWKWYAHSQGYAVRTQYDSVTKKKYKILMHREILKPTENYLTDHINGNKLDNRRCNLRECTFAQNMANRKAHSDSRTGIKGIVWHSKARKWRARIKVNKKYIEIGLFKTKEEAGFAYIQAAKKYNGEFCFMNGGDSN